MEVNMSFFYLSLISGYSIALAVFIGLVRFLKIERSYRPFIYICCAALINELLSLIIIQFVSSNAINANIYVLIELLLFSWQFYAWGSLRKYKWQWPLLLFFLSGIWIFDNLIWNDLSHFNSLFRIASSFCLIFLSIDQLNKLIFSETGNLLRHPRFLICTGIVIYYSYKATIEVFYLLKLNFSNSFYDNIFFFLSLINILINLIFALAVLWIPRKQKYMLPF